MGLDAVELVMEVEDAFQVSIPFDTYSDLKTVGDMHAFLMRRLTEFRVLESTATSNCSLKKFVMIRQSLLSLLSASRRQIRPSTSLAEIVPRSKRRDLWMALNGHANLKLPCLTFPNHVWFLCRLLPSTCLCVGIVSLAEGLGFGDIVMLLALGGMLSLVWRMLTEPFKTDFPLNCRTVGDLVRFALTPRLPSLTGMSEEVDSDAVWKELVTIVCSTLGVSPDDVKPESRFVEDLFC